MSGPTYTEHDKVPSDKQLLSVGELAQLFSVHVDTVRRWYRVRGLPAMRQGAHGRIVFDRQAAMTWYRRFCVSPAGRSEMRRARAAI